jgi:hypothetical protein
MCTSEQLGIGIFNLGASLLFSSLADGLTFEIAIYFLSAICGILSVLHFTLAYLSYKEFGGMKPKYSYKDEWLHDLDKEEL